MKMTGFRVNTPKNSIRVSSTLRTPEGVTDVYTPTDKGHVLLKSMKNGTNKSYSFYANSTEYAKKKMLELFKINAK